MQGSFQTAALLPGRWISGKKALWKAGVGGVGGCGSQTSRFSGGTKDTSFGAVDSATRNILENCFKNGLPTYMMYVHHRVPHGNSHPFWRETHSKRGTTEMPYCSRNCGVLAVVHRFPSLPTCRHLSGNSRSPKTADLPFV